MASRPIRCALCVVLPATLDWLSGHKAHRFPVLQRGVNLREDHRPMRLGHPGRQVPHGATAALGRRAAGTCGRAASTVFTTTSGRW